MERLQYDNYEYRRGKRLIIREINNPVFNLRVNETDSVFNVNGVVVSRAMLGKSVKGRLNSFAELCEFLCIAWNVMDNIDDSAPDWAKYLTKKAKRIFKALEVTDDRRDALLSTTLIPWTSAFTNPDISDKVVGKKKPGGIPDEVLEGLLKALTKAMERRKKSDDDDTPRTKH